MSDCLEMFATAYREAFEELREEGIDDVFLSHFPGGCCSLSVEVMCAHLRSLGWDDVNYTGGNELDGDGSHSWLTCGDTIVDITADQFDDNFPSVYVGDGMELHDKYECKTMDVRLDCYESGLISSIRSKAVEKLQQTDFNDEC